MALYLYRASSGHISTDKLQTIKNWAVSARDRQMKIFFLLLLSPLICLGCAPGYYLNPQPPGCNLCPVGHYCNGTIVPCAEGYYANETGMVSCEVCQSPPGYYCPSGATSPNGIGCPDGYNCQGGGSPPIGCGCSPGSYCPGGSQCTNCPVGRFCLGGSQPAALCMALPGKYCPTGSSSPYGVNCPVGRFCLGNESLPILCPVGTYSIGGAAICFNTPVGSYNIGEGNSGYSLCLPGSYNTLPGSSCKLCPAGWMSGYGAVECTECYDHPSYSPVEGSPECLYCTSPGYYRYNNSQCLICPAGYYCTGGMNISCPRGCYCPAGSSGHVTCPNGTYFLEERGEEIADCIPCPAGMKCPMPSLTPINCSIGMYSLGSQTFCTECSVGRYGTSSGDCLSCDPGYYSPEPGMNSCTACPSGTYCNATECSSCTPCPIGTISDSPAGEGCLPCGQTGECPLGSSRILSSLELVGEYLIIDPLDTLTATKEAEKELIIICVSSSSVLLIVIISVIYFYYRKRDSVKKAFKVMDIIYDTDHYTVLGEPIIRREKAIGAYFTILAIAVILILLSLSLVGFVYDKQYIRGVVPISPPFRPKGQFGISVVFVGAVDCTDSNITLPSIDGFVTAKTNSIDNGFCSSSWECSDCTFVAPSLTTSFSINGPYSYASGIKYSVMFPAFVDQYGNRMGEPFILSGSVIPTDPMNNVFRGGPSAIDISMIPVTFKHQYVGSRAQLTGTLLGNEVGNELFHTQKSVSIIFTVKNSPSIYQVEEVSKSVLTLFASMGSLVAMIIAGGKVTMKALKKCFPKKEKSSEMQMT